MSKDYYKFVAFELIKAFTRLKLNGISSGPSQAPASEPRSPVLVAALLAARLPKPACQRLLRAAPARLRASGKHRKPWKPPGALLPSAGAVRPLLHRAFLPGCSDPTGRSAKPGEPSLGSSV